MQLKRIVKLILIQAIYLTCAIAVYAGENKLCSKSTEGTNFWFGFMESRNYIDPHNTKIIVTARETTTFTITVGKSETQFNGTYTVNADSSTEVTIPWQMVETTGSEEVQDKGIHLVSQKPVNVFALNWDPYSADAAVIYPVEALGTEYFAMCYQPNVDPKNPETGSGRNSEFLIVAVEDQTKVEITPSKVTDKLNPRELNIPIVLNRGEVYQVQSENLQGTGKAGQGDLTGSHIIADKPVAFYSGALATTVLNVNCCWDHLCEQIPPVHSWGREYFTVPLKTRERDIYRVLAAQNNTTVQISGEPVFYLNRGEFREFELFQDNPKRIISDKPILAAQFSMSQNADSSFNGGNGDPFMLILNSVEQSISEVTFVNFQSPIDISDSTYLGIKKQFVNIVALTAGLAGIQLDGQSVQSEFKPLPGLSYSYAQIETKPGTHHIENVNGTNGFLAYIYGFGKWESYGYSSGFNVNINLDLGENIEFFKGDTLLLCFGDTLKLDAGSQFDTLKWSTGEVSQSIAVSDSGLIWVEAATKDGCKLRDSVFVFQSHPVIDIGDRNDTGCEPYSVRLNGGTGFEKYVWQNELNDTLSTNNIYIAAESNEYRLTVYNNYRCNASDTFSLTVFPVPEIEIKGEHLICGIDSANLLVTISGTADSIWNYPGNYKWDANSSEISLSEETQTSVKIIAGKWGDYEIYYRIKTINDCERADTFKIRFHPQPENGFVIDDDPACSGYSKILRFTGKVTGAAKFDWDLNGRAFLDTFDLQKQVFLISVGALQPNSSPISLTIDDKGCISDTIKPFPNSNPNFTMEADNIRGCDNMTVSFTGKMITTDVVDFIWTFSDTLKTTGQVVAKNFAGPGFFKVNLTVKNTLSGCTNSFTIDSMIHVYPTPVADIATDHSVCYPDSAMLVYSNSIESTYYKWEFSGKSLSGFDLDSVYILIDRPYEKIRLTVNEFGCFSKPDSVWLKRRPDFDFETESQEGCQPYSVEVFATTEDNYLNFNWIIDTLPYPAGLSNFYFFPDTGRFDIGLIATSGETQCADTILKPGWIWVHKKPYSKFIPEHEIVLLDNATLSFDNTSENALNFYWNFDDSVSSQETDPVHTYNGVGKYHVQLIAEANFGCTDTFGMDLQVIPSVTFAPNAFRPDSEIPENKTFMPVGAGVDESRFNLKIYNRWGELVFETESLINPWNGTLRNGKTAPMGNYVWISKYFDIQGVERNEKGQVFLIR